MTYNNALSNASTVIKLSNYRVETSQNYLERL